MCNRKIEEKKTMQIVIETTLHQMLRLEAAKRSVTIKTLVEGYIAEGIDKDAQTFKNPASIVDSRKE